MRKNVSGETMPNANESVLQARPGNHYNIIWEGDFWTSPPPPAFESYTLKGKKKYWRRARRKREEGKGEIIRLSRRLLP